MSYTYDLNSEHGLVVIRVTDHRWTGADLLDSAEEVVSDDQFAPGYDWVYDARSVRVTVIGPEDMERVVDRFRTYREEGRVDSDSRSVIITGEENIQMTGVLYKYRSNRSDNQFEIVDTLEEARRWLGIEKTPSEIKG